MIVLEPEDSRLLLLIFSQMAADDVTCWDSAGAIAHTPVYRISNDPDEDEAVDRLEGAGLLVSAENKDADAGEFPRLAMLTPSGYLAVMSWSFQRATKKHHISLQSEYAQQLYRKMCERLTADVAQTCIRFETLTAFLMDCANATNVITERPPNA